MEAAGYVKVGDIFTGGEKWLTHKEIQEHAIVTLATEKGRLTEYVIEQVNAGNFIFDVVLLGHIAPGAEPQHTYMHITAEFKKRKYLPFLPEKIVTDAVEYPSFHLLQTPTYGEDITNVNAVYLIPRGYRISRITILEKISQGNNLPDILIVRLTCEDLRYENNAHEMSQKQCQQCGGINMPDSLFCSRCGTRF